jgi:hypothetical protein
VMGGRILVSVHADDSAWERRAKDILGRGATEVSSAAEAPVSALPLE